MATLKQAFEEYAHISQGVVTWPFSQDLVHSRGVCVSLCAHWIRYHSMDKHLREELHDESARCKFNKYAIRRVQSLQEVEPFWLPRSAQYPSTDSELIISWLRAFGLCLQTNITNGDWTRSFYRENYNPNRPPHHAYPKHATRLMLGAIMKYISYYLLITVDNLDHSDAYSNGSGHAFCAWFGQLSGGDVCFYDPNVGEVWFEQRKHFDLFASKYLNYFMTMYDYTHWDLLPVARPAFPLGM